MRIASKIARPGGPEREPFATSLAERIATVAQSRRSGRWGEFTDLGDGAACVEADGRMVLIRSERLHWTVMVFGSDMAGADADLETAIALALESAPARAAA